MLTRELTTLELSLFKGYIFTALYFLDTNKIYFLSLPNKTIIESYVYDLITYIILKCHFVQFVYLYTCISSRLS